MQLDRHQARSVAFQALFVMTSNPEQTADEAIQMVIAADSATVNLEDEEIVAIDATDPNQVYAQKLVVGVTDAQETLDAELTPKLKGGWTLKRISKTDLIILRLGLYEISHEAVPDAVAIDEAIQLAKEFSDEQSAKFINGVLATFISKASK
ncbi:transcription antitermination factor NusB [Lapidilactobacillus mulanensis]|uniref:Transcription antitermination protein NusB n=1 Tax=Lapidilactobacillus mulanensis TaxID=2485999 RepID=A0ABW4DPV6_9LACO|nr:transcription antitermination factor NusB [Lapidilactobacillus mulanensis]